MSWLVLHEVYTAPVSHVELLCSLHIKSDLDMATCVLHVWSKHYNNNSFT